MSYSELASPKATREVLAAHGHDPKYRLGQNFLVDDNVVGHILELTGLLPEGAGPGPAVDAARLPTVLEIGPGIGTLTVALLKSAKVIAVERDADLVPILAETTALNSDRFALVQGDALKLGWGQVEGACAALGGAAPPTMLVANLPYQIAATVILDWFERFDALQRMVVMVQSEVADRIQAQVGTKDYGAYTIKLRLHARVAGRFQVPASCFMPRPHVESAVIRLERNEASGDAALVSRACELADAAFAQRRKNIRNSMSSKLDKGFVDGLLAAGGIDPRRRGETLAPEDYLRLASVGEGDGPLPSPELC